MPHVGGTEEREPWVSVDDVAAHLGVVKDSVYRWIDRRGLPAIKLGKLWKLKLSEVDAWVRATAEVALPPVPAVPSTSALHARSLPAKRVILVVDDDRLVRETVGDFLADVGFTAVLASDGEQALTLLATAVPRPSLIVLDLGMPNVDGWRFRDEQLRQPDLASIPVIVVTAVSNANVHGALVLRSPCVCGNSQRRSRAFWEPQRGPRRPSMLCSREPSSRTRRDRADALVGTS